MAVYKPKPGKSLVDLKPSLIYEWSSKNKLEPHEYSGNSSQKVWWICNKGHEWEARISDRTKKSGCPFCTNQKVLVGYNDLASSRPDLSREWSTKNILGPERFTKYSGKKVWWVCSEGHEWEAEIKGRSYGRGCRLCSISRVSNHQSTPTSGSSLGDLYPDLVAEWSPTNTSSPSDYKPFSSKKVVWSCKSGHSWASSIANRTNGSKCPMCSDNQNTNQKLVEFLSKRYNTHREFTTGLRWTSGAKIIVDAYCSEANLVIEYDGYRWHKDRVNFDRDTYKTLSILDAGYSIVRLRQIPLLELDITHPNLLQLQVKWDSKYKYLEDAVAEVVGWSSQR